MSRSQVTIIPIGSSSSGNSLYIHINDIGFLVDAGIKLPNVLTNINKQGFNDIDYLFVSHTHIDHIKYLKNIVKELNPVVLASVPVCELIDYTTNKEPLDYFYKKELNKGLFVTMIKTYHDSKGPSGYVFEKDGVKIGYVTDTGMITKQMLNILKGSQIVIMESNHDIEMLENGPYPVFLQERIKSNYGHLSNEQCSKTCRWLAENGTKYFFLAHLSEENNNPELALEVTSNALKDLETDVYVLPKYDGETKTVEIEHIENKICNDEKTYNYCLIKIKDKTTKYWYLDESKSHKVNDEVIVPLGKKNKEAKGIITEIIEYKESELPYPLEDTKRILIKEYS